MEINAINRVYKLVSGQAMQRIDKKKLILIEVIH